MARLDVLAFMAARYGHSSKEFKKQLEQGHICFGRKARQQMNIRLLVARDIHHDLAGIREGDDPLADATKPPALMFVDVGPLGRMSMCSRCERVRTLSRWNGQILRYGMRVPATGRRCHACGDTMVDASMMQRQEQIVARRLASRGLRAANHFKLARKIAEVSEAEIARIAGARPADVKRWESGMTPLPAAASKRLADLILQNTIAHRTAAGAER
jgi:DNA-binding transcriptional regulator YiaG